MLQIRRQLFKRTFKNLQVWLLISDSKTIVTLLNYVYDESFIQSNQNIPVRGLSTWT